VSVFIASVRAAERQNFHARAASPNTRAVSRFFKKLLFQWRRKSGRWPVAKAIQHLTANVASRKSGVSDDSDSRSDDIRNSHGLDDQTGVVGRGAEGYKEHLVFVMVQQRLQLGFQLCEPHWVERTLENGVLQTNTEAFHSPRYFSQPFRVANIVADEKSNAAHRVVNP
jgi:hypothetical protein